MGTRHHLIAAALGALATPALAQAPSAPSLSLTGRVAHPHDYGLAELAALPNVAADRPVSGKSSDKPGAHVAGVLLWTLLDQAGWVDQPGRKTHLQHVIMAHGRDGYVVALSIGEVDPALEGKAVMVTTERDGKPADRLDLFVPGDKRAARHVHDLIGVEVE